MENLLFLNECGELESAEPAYWDAESGVSDPGESGAGLVPIVSLSTMLFMFSFKNTSVSSFSIDDRK